MKHSLNHLRIYIGWNSYIPSRFNRLYNIRGIVSQKKKKKRRKKKREMGQYKTSLLHLGEEFCFRIHISEAGI